MKTKGLSVRDDSQPVTQCPKCRRYFAHPARSGRCPKCGYKPGDLDLEEQRKSPADRALDHIVERMREEGRTDDEIRQIVGP